jgi:prefoldin subunit 5
MDGNQVAEAPVSNGSTTVVVSHLKSGVYIAKVGNEALKFIKK